MKFNKSLFYSIPEIISLPKWEKDFYYILNVADQANYDQAMVCIFRNLKSKKKIRQRAAIEASGILARRFKKIEKNLILPILFKNLKSQDRDIVGKTIDALDDILGAIPKLGKRIFLSYIRNERDLFSGNKLKKYSDISEFKKLTTKEEKREFILSFCQSSKNYDDAFKMCINYLKENDSDINIAAIQGLIYLIMRFKKINLEEIKPILKHYISLEDCRGVYAESLLRNISEVIPKLRNKALATL